MLKVLPDGIQENPLTMLQKKPFLTDFQNTALKINKISNLSILNPVICIQSLLLSVVDIQWSMVWKKGSIQINQDQSRVG